MQTDLSQTMSCVNIAIYKISYSVNSLLLIASNKIIAGKKHIDVQGRVEGGFKGIHDYFHNPPPGVTPNTAYERSVFIHKGNAILLE